MKTYSPKPEHIERRWYVVDASDQVLGRIASEVAALLRGKHKPIFAPHMDTGDHVIVINADKVVVTGGKEFKKVAYRHSGLPRRHHRRPLRQAARGPPGVRRREGHPGHAAEEPPGPHDDQQAPRRGRPRAPARRPEAGALHVRSAARVGGPAHAGAPAAEDPAPGRGGSRREAGLQAEDHEAGGRQAGRPRSPRAKKSDGQEVAATAPKKASAAKKSTAKKKTTTKKTKAKAEPEAKAETTESTEE